MADDCLFDNEESDDERAVREEAEVTLDLKDRWFGIANSTGTLKKFLQLLTDSRKVYFTSKVGSHFALPY